MEPLNSSLIEVSVSQLKSVVGDWAQLIIDINKNNRRTDGFITILFKSKVRTLFKYQELYKHFKFILNSLGFPIPDKTMSDFVNTPFSCKSSIKINCMNEKR